MNTVSSSVPIHGLPLFQCIPRPQHNDRPEVDKRAARAAR